MLDYFASEDTVVSHCFKNLAESLYWVDIRKTVVFRSALTLKNPCGK